MSNLLIMFDLAWLSGNAKECYESPAEMKMKMKFNIFISSFISQTIYVILPGRQPLNYYLCAGIDNHQVDFGTNQFQKLEDLPIKVILTKSLRE
jgi:hypothetical protein